MGTIQELKQWISDLLFPGEFKEFVYVTGDSTSKKTKEKLFKCSIYTDEHIYQIVAIESDANNYLGCQATARKERPGEAWKRGNDLADGELTYDTWIRIVRDIVKYELVRLSEFRKPNMSPE
jgi:hypothetical protein